MYILDSGALTSAVDAYTVCIIKYYVCIRIEYRYFEVLCSMHIFRPTIYYVIFLDPDIVYQYCVISLCSDIIYRVIYWYSICLYSDTKYNIYDAIGLYSDIAYMM